MQTTQTFTRTQFGSTFTAEAYTTDGLVWRWTSNDAVVPLDAAADYGIPVDQAAQRVARDAEIQAFVAAYRANPPQPSAEQLAEMRAAFGPGAVVVDVISGQRTQL